MLTHVGGSADDLREEGCRYTSLLIIHENLWCYQAILLEAFRSLHLFNLPSSSPSGICILLLCATHQHTHYSKVSPVVFMRFILN